MVRTEKKKVVGGGKEVPSTAERDLESCQVTAQAHISVAVLGIRGGRKRQTLSRFKPSRCRRHSVTLGRNGRPGANTQSSPTVQCFPTCSQAWESQSSLSPSTVLHFVWLHESMSVVTGFRHHAIPFRLIFPHMNALHYFE
ncbi:hypothetical protein MVEN_00530000 [Mycena venus]|uniref:Uncharacterized protein n=1 Tax=Mycena venus TaxID=2733690 RepID=A0A8H7D575_9AGAR|nr:hypothetical protein MVEN_00530000 [Mycena venus]